MDLAASFAAYLAQDRLASLASGTELGPGEGTVVFADISGFTTLTSGLSAVYGPRRGAGELSRSLGVVYDGLVAAVETWHGSVISFAGDAILCWFGAPEGGASVRAAHAAACARQMLAFLSALPPLEMAGGATVKIGLKVAITSGTARRLCVGNPDLQFIDLLTGHTVLRAAEIEKGAATGEVLFDDATRALLVQVRGEVDPPPRTDRALPSLDQLRPWILPAVWDRESAGVGRFLPEFRPTVALFLRFTGFDYDSESTEGHLDFFIRGVQRALANRGGTLLHVEIGDKGSYLYGAFGAPEVHADDARRAVLTALELRTWAADTGFLHPVQIGLSRGIMRTGSYGSQGRGCYSALGDEVNVAARLMEMATPGQILLAGRVRVELGPEFEVEPVGAQAMKGREGTIPTYLLKRMRKPGRMKAPVAEALPLFGREPELGRLTRALEQARGGCGSVRVLSGEPGVGKTRLAEELGRTALAQGCRVIVAQISTPGATPWQVWRLVWAELFGSGETLVDPTGWETLDPRDRKAALESRALADFRSRVLESDLAGGLMVVLNDAHALDQASLDLFLALAESLATLPVLLVATCRPSEFSQTCAQRLPHAPLELQALERAPSMALIRDRAPFTDEVAEAIYQKSRGNPFFLDELVRFFHYRKELNDLPDSVHALVLNRLDEIPIRDQSFLKCASILGLRFSAEEISACFPEVRATDALVVRLIEHGFLAPPTPSAGSEQEFRHPLTREALYESIDSTTRADLHNRYGLWLEDQGTHPGDHLEALAHHFFQGGNLAKSRTYLALAGDAATAAYLNTAATAHYRRLLSLEPERAPVLLKLASVLELVGEWQEARTLVEEALALCPTGPMHWRSLTALGRMARRRGSMDEAEQRLTEALAGWVESGDGASQCECSLELATLHISRGNYPEAAQQIAHARATGAWEAKVASAQGYWALAMADYGAAEAAFTSALESSRREGNRRGIADAIDNLARVRHALGDLGGASEAYARSLDMYRSMGDQQAVGRTLNTCGMVAWSQGQNDLALARFQESLTISRSLGDKPGQAKSLNNIGTLHHSAGEFDQARALYRDSLALCRELGERRTTSHILCNLGMIEGRFGRHDDALECFSEAQTLGEALGDRWMQGYTRLHRGMLQARQGEYAWARGQIEESLTIMDEVGNAGYRLHALVALVTLYTRGAEPSPATDQAAAGLVGWILEALARDKVRLESEFLQPWAEAQTELARRVSSPVAAQGRQDGASALLASLQATTSPQL